jgi:hypothetical protein
MGDLGVQLPNAVLTKQKEQSKAMKWYFQLQ